MLAVMSIWLGGCGQGEQQAGDTASSTTATATAGATAANTTAAKEPASTAPVTLKVLMSPSEDYFNQFIAAPVKAKFPNVTMQYYDVAKHPVDQLVMTGEIPDIYNGYYNTYRMKEFQLQYDLTPLIKKYNFNVTRIDDALMQSTKEFSVKGELDGLPANRNGATTVYSKDIFDKFGVPYPKDGMTWDDMLSLAAKMTRTADGIEYSGFHLNSYLHIKRELGLSFFDANGKAQVTTPGWQKLAQTMKAINAIPGNNPKGGTYGIFTNKNIAIDVGGLVSFLHHQDQISPQVNWDIATYPVFKEAPESVPSEFGNIYAIPVQSKNKDIAFQIIAYLLSDELQKMIAVGGNEMSSLKNPELQKAFGSELPLLKGKNVAAIFKLKPTAQRVEDNYSTANSVMNKALANMLAKNQDINTALREAEEQLNKSVAELNSR
jgi:multiple sugar transport system substrate-binding protein